MKWLQLRMCNIRMEFELFQDEATDPTASDNTLYYRGANVSKKVIVLIDVYNTLAYTFELFINRISVFSVILLNFPFVTKRLNSCNKNSVRTKRVEKFFF